MSWTKQELAGRVDQLIEEYGEWSYDIPLPHRVWTRGNEGVPHTRLKRIFQVACDLSTKPLHSCRVLDLGCLDGQFSIEFALTGAEVVGVEVREASIQKALLAKESLRLENLKFIQDDVRNISREKQGQFDVIVCSGLLYHLDTPDVFALIEHMYEMTKRLVIIDTHVSLSPKSSVTYKGQTYFGHHFREFADEDTEVAKEQKLWASWGNPVSFRFTRPSLVNFLSHAGFTSAYECFTPPHLNYGEPGLEHKDRCTFVAVKGRKQSLTTSPVANDLIENHPEGSLSYATPSQERQRQKIRQLREENNNLRRQLRDSRGVGVRKLLSKLGYIRARVLGK